MEAYFNDWILLKILLSVVIAVSIEASLNVIFGTILSYYVREFMTDVGGPLTDIFIQGPTLIVKEAFHYTSPFHPDFRDWYPVLFDLIVSIVEIIVNILSAIYNLVISILLEIISGVLKADAILELLNPFGRQLGWLQPSLVLVDH